MQSWLGSIPYATVEPIAVFRDACQIHYAEIRRVAWPGVGVVGMRFAKIVEACPHELPQIPGIIVSQGEVYVGNVAPERGPLVVRRALQVLRSGAEGLFHREVINPAGTHAGGCFAAKDKALGQHAYTFQKHLRAVVVTGHIHGGGKTVAVHRPHLIHTAGNGTSRVFAMADILKETGGLNSSRHAL